MAPDTPQMPTVQARPARRAQPPTAPARRTPARIAGNFRRLVTAGVTALAAAVPFAAAAEQIVAFMPPAAMSTVTNNVDHALQADVALFNGCNPNDHVRFASSAIGSIFGSAQAGKGVAQFATAGGPESGGGLGEASIWMFVKDPQDRGTVKLSMTVNGFALATPPNAVPITSANFLVGIGKIRGTPSALVLDDGCTVKSTNWISDWTDYAYMVMGYDYYSLDLTGNVHHTNALNHYVNGVLTTSTQQTSQPINQTLEVTPNQGGMIITVRATSGGGVAVVDPIITAHPDNPDVVIEFTGVPDLDTGRRPLDGVSADNIAALGLDPQPFVDLGFVAAPPPSDGGGGDPPPSDGGGSGDPPPTAPKYWCSPGFWLNNAVKFGASAWPSSERTYYDYNSTAGQVAGCPTASGNPTLLDVLQNAGRYFSTQQKGGAFNCIGDYLSKTSGLTGTVGDNNGVCSLDQFGRSIQ